MRAELAGVVRHAVIVSVALVAVIALRCLPPASEHGLVDIHVRLAEGGIAQFAGSPLFTHLPATAHDARARWLRVVVPADRATAMLAELARDPNVDEAFVAPEVGLPALPSLPSLPSVADSCPIETPSFESYQGYIGPAPSGIDAPAAWRRGVRGAGVWFADVEGNWNPGHEDLPGERIRHIAGQPIDQPGWRQHGTAVLGEVVGRDNGKGVVGIAPDVERVFTSSIGRATTADAIDAAAEQLRAGDVLLIELHQRGPRGHFLPVEFWDDSYDAIVAATRRGVIVIEAAGNGAENLDHRAYKGKLERSTRDSGAIMVGAGAPARAGFTDRERLDFSNYGSRVDVQGWGRKVATLDYGDLQDCAGAERHRHYTGEFAGTSSASPIVAGAAVLLEGYARQHGGPLSPAAVRDVLRSTGTPQRCPAKCPDPIGPRPDLARALAAIPSG